MKVLTLIPGCFGPCPRKKHTYQKDNFKYIILLLLFNYVINFLSQWEKKNHYKYKSIIKFEIKNSRYSQGSIFRISDRRQSEYK